jgi:YHS domain-containing protein
VASAWGDPPIAWRTDYDHALGESKATGKLLLVNIHASWCIPCKKLNSTTLADPTLGAEIMQSCIPVSLDADQDAGVIRQWPITGFPTQLFLTPEGEVINTIVGHVPVATYQATLRKSIASVASMRRQPAPAQVASINNPAPPSAKPVSNPLPTNSPAAGPAMNQGDFVAPIRNNGFASANAPQPAPVATPPSIAPPQPSFVPGGSSITSVLPATSAPSGLAGTTPTPAAPMASGATAAVVSPPPSPTAVATNAPLPQATPEVRSSVVGSSSVGDVRPCDASVPLALDGYCPVSMFKRSELIRGADDQCCVYKERRYQFISASDREAFIQNPKKFLPSEEGFCVVTWAESHRRAQGSIEFPALFGDYLFLFASDDARQRFLQDPERFVDQTGRAHRIPLHTFRGDRANVR